RDRGYRNDEAGAEPVVLEPPIEHHFERAEEGGDQQEANDIEASGRTSFALSAGRIAAIAAIVASPTGKLIKKHQRQEMLSASHPPSVGPTTGPTTTATPNSANAWPRLSGGKASARMDCDTGTMPPPARPCMIRNKSSVSR